MNHKPDEKDLMAYLYGELEGEEKLRVEKYLQDHAAAREQLMSFRQLRETMSALEDKEVIAPSIVIDNTGQRFLWNTPHFRTIISIAAALLLIILVGKATDTRVDFSGEGLMITFGEPTAVEPDQPPAQSVALTVEEVQRMIDSSLTQSNDQVRTTLEASHEKLQASIRQNLAANSGRIDNLVRQAALASQEQVQQYVAGLQAQNSEMVKEYFRLSSADQKEYVEDILVDFAQYVQQQRANDLQMVQTQLSSMQQNTDLFKQETEQILSSIISNVGVPPSGLETKN